MAASGNVVLFDKQGKPTAVPADSPFMQVTDLEGSVGELRLVGLMFGVFDAEAIVSEADAYRLVRLACEKYLQLHPEDTTDVNDLLAKLPA